MPLGEDILQAIVGLSLCPFNQVTDLKAFLTQFNDSFVVLGENLTLSHLKLFEVALFLSCQSFLLASLGVDGLSQDSLLLVELLELLCKLLVLGHILLALLNTDAVVLRNGVQFGQSVPQLFKLVNLLIP